jgi:hypothetical protein
MLTNATNAIVLKVHDIRPFCLRPVSKADAEGLGTTISPPPPPHPPPPGVVFLFLFGYSAP